MIALKDLIPGATIRNLHTKRVDKVIRVDGDTVYLESGGLSFTRILTSVLLSWELLT